MKRITSSAAKQLVTDYDNVTYDTGRWLGMVAVLAILFLAGWDVIVNHHEFKAQDVGIAVASVISGIGIYLIGDNRRPVQPPQQGVDIEQGR